MTRSFDIFSDLRSNIQLSKQWRRRRFEIPWRSSWRHCHEVLVVAETWPHTPLLLWKAGKWSMRWHVLDNHYALHEWPISNCPYTLAFISIDPNRKDQDQYRLGINQMCKLPDRCLIDVDPGRVTVRLLGTFAAIINMCLCKVRYWFSFLIHNRLYYSDVIMDAMASQITCLAIVYLNVYSGADQRKHHRNDECTSTTSQCRMTSIL